VPVSTNPTLEKIQALIKFLQPTTDLHLHTARGSIDLSHSLLAQSINNVYQPGISFMMHEEANYRAEFCHITMEKNGFHIDSTQHSAIYIGAYHLW